MLKFKVNDYLALKLENKKTFIYVAEEKFRQCKFLLLDIPIEEIRTLDNIDSIDEVSKDLDHSLEGRKRSRIPPEVIFWGHCSNLQACYEHDYDTRLLHSNLAFPLLKRLTEVGDQMAKRSFKLEIAKRIDSGYVPTIIYLVMEGYLRCLNREEICTLIQSSKNIESKLKLGRQNALDFIYGYYDKKNQLNTEELILLIEHNNIRLFELLIKDGKRFFDMDGKYIGEFRNWVTNILDKLVREEPKYLKSKIKQLLDQNIMAKPKKEKIVKIVNGLKFHMTKSDYSEMDEFSTLLYSRKIYALKDLS